MNRMRKTFIALLTVVALICISVITFTACNSGKDITGIEITTAPTKTDYLAGEKFDPTGMVVSLVYKNEKKETLEEYSYSPDGALKISDRSITVTYTSEDGEAYTAKQDIKVHNDITNVVLKQNPENTQYVVGETFNPLGMVVTVTFENGTSEDVEITSSNATYKTAGLTKDDVMFEVSYSNHSVTVELTIMNGIFVEAENGEVVKAAGGNYLYGDAVNMGDKYDATGGLYVGDLSAGDSITFKFKSDSAGKADIAFRMASQYLLAEAGENSWTPVEIGECQLNKLCKVYVNGAELTVDDSVVLPGAKSENGGGDSKLWMLWQLVWIEDVDLIEGDNTIKLEFQYHNYNDHIHDEKDGIFAANVDSVKVVTECNVEAFAFSYNVSGAKIAVDEEKAAYIVYGTYSISGYSQDDAESFIKAIMLDLQGNPYMQSNHATWDGNWDYNAFYAYEVTFGTAEDGSLTFEAKYDITNLEEYCYTSHYGGTSSDNDFKPEMAAYNQSITVGNKKYTMIYVPNGGNEDFYGCVGIRIESATPAE